jgi:Kef-type K+ transport system membrane component KefB/Trk K+ transport system NAD-binding subunit
MVFTEISTIIALAALIALIMRALRQPLIIGHIITGIIAGPSLLKILHADAAFSGLSDIGVALLLFIIGLDLSVRVFSRVGKAVLVTTVVQVATVTGIGYVAAQLIGFGQMESAILGLGLAMSSTIIIVKILNDKKETTRLYAQIAIGVLLLQDIVATVAKIALASRSQQTDPSVATLYVLLLRGLGLGAVMYLVSRYLIPWLTNTLERNKELLLLFALGWGLGFAQLFAKAGFSIEIGALFAGVSLASLPYSSEMASRLKPLRDFFIVIFFITLGQAMSPDKLVHVIAPALALSLVVLLIKPLVVLISLGGLGYTKRASFKTAVAMSQVSEFSLVFLVAALNSGLVSERASTTLTLTALITFAVSTYLMKYDNELYTKLEDHLRLFERHLTKVEQRGARNRYSIVQFGYRKGGHEFLKTFKKMGKRFVVVDYDPDAIETLERQEINYLYGDATDPELLEEVQLEHAKLVVSTMSAPETNLFLAHWLSTHNPGAVFVCSADSAEHAAELYEEGVAYVMLPHYIGSERISNFIRKNGFNKTEFKRFREKHLVYLQAHHEEFAPLEEPAEIG